MRVESDKENVNTIFQRYVPTTIEPALNDHLSKVNTTYFELMVALNRLHVTSGFFKVLFISNVVLKPNNKPLSFR